jgi:microsomal prostaglandin-E synthase 2
MFFRYTTCPFCSKVKAFLDVHDIEHTLVEVEPMFKSQIKYIDYKKVPALRFNVSGHDGPYLVDSDLIIDKLAPLLGAGAQLKDPEVVKWRTYARESLVRHLVMNINKTLPGAWEGYSYIDSFDTIPYANKLFLKVMGAPVMYAVAMFMTKPKLLKAGELKEGDDVRQVLHGKVKEFIDDGLKPAKAPFHGGQAPDLADIDVYGVFQSVRGHKIYDDMLVATEIRPWMDRMDKATGKPVYVPAAEQ